MSFNSIVDYVRDGTTTDYVVPFPFLDRTHVYVYFDDVYQSTGYTWVNDGLIRFTTGGTNGVALRVKRITPSAPVVTFNDLSVLVDDDLNSAILQMSYLLEETADFSVDSAVSAGNVPTPANPADNNKLLTANLGTFGWSSALSVATAATSGNATIGGRLNVTGNTSLSGTLAAGNTTITGTLTASGNSSLGGTLAITGNVTASAGLAVTGNETVGGTLGITGNTSMGNATLTGTLTVPTITSGTTITFGKDLVPSGNGTLNIGATGSRVLAAYFSNGGIKSNLCGGRMNQATKTVASANTSSSVTWTSLAEEVLPVGGSTGFNAAGYRVPKAGVYLIHADASYSSATAGTRTLEMAAGSTGSIYSSTTAATVSMATGLSLTNIVRLSVLDVIGVSISQSFATSTDYNCNLCAWFLGD
jgi:hypothetical protein